MSSNSDDKISDVLKAIEKLKLIENISKNNNINSNKSIKNSRMQLRELFRRFSDREKFNSGDLVSWKKGLKNRTLPHDGEMAIVIEQLATPVVDNEVSSGSPFFRENLDLIAGVIHDNGDFLVFYYDSRRFTKEREE